MTSCHRDVHVANVGGAVHEQQPGLDGAALGGDARAGVGQLDVLGNVCGELLGRAAGPTKVSCDRLPGVTSCSATTGPELRSPFKLTANEVAIGLTIAHELSE